MSSNYKIKITKFYFIQLKLRFSIASPLCLTSKFLFPLLDLNVSILQVLPRPPFFLRAVHRASTLHQSCVTGRGKPSGPEVPTLEFWPHYLLGMQTPHLASLCSGDPLVKSKDKTEPSRIIVRTQLIHIKCLACCLKRSKSSDSVSYGGMYNLSSKPGHFEDFERRLLIITPERQEETRTVLGQPGQPPN